MYDTKQTTVELAQVGLSTASVCRGWDATRCSETNPTPLYDIVSQKKRCCGAVCVKPGQLSQLTMHRQMQRDAVAAAKHHIVIATELGGLFTWGSNRGTCDAF